MERVGRFRVRSSGENKDPIGFNIHYRELQGSEVLGLSRRSCLQRFYEDSSFTSLSVASVLREGQFISFTVSLVHPGVI